jgi:hypothetical protein
MKFIQCANDGFDLPYCKRHFKPSRRGPKTNLCRPCREVKDREQSRLAMQKLRAQEVAQMGPAQNPEAASSPEATPVAQ